MNMEENALVKYTFLKLLLKEFDLHIKEFRRRKNCTGKTMCRDLLYTEEFMKNKLG